MSDIKWSQQSSPTYFTDKHALSMTLRDYFAAKMMQAWLTDPNVSWDNDHLLRAAENAYDAADAMLKARGK